MEETMGKHYFNRRKLRDTVLICCFVSAFVFGTGTANIIIGFSLLALGAFFHVVAKGILIRNRILCNRGIYSVVRHPYYLANYLIDSSFCIFSGNLYLLLVYPFLFFWSYGPTLRKEEQVLASNHGEAYQKDSFAIPQVFPDEASLKGWLNIFEGFSPQRITFKECSRIVKFCSLGFFITLIHELKAEGLTGLNHLLKPTGHDYDEFVFLMIVVVLFSVSSLLLRMARNARLQKTQEANQSAA